MVCALDGFEAVGQVVGKVGGVGVAKAGGAVCMAVVVGARCEVGILHEGLLPVK